MNPVQEFNRDLSVACITAWGELLNEEKRGLWEKKREREKERAEKGKGKSNEEGGDAKRRKTDADGASAVDATPAGTTSTDYRPSKLPKEYRPYRFSVLEALSATGLRSIRYAKELPLLDYVLANDLSPAATEAIHRNLEFNGLAAKEGEKGKVRVNQGDACTLMYAHRDLKANVDVVDLDPYGTAAPFIDAGVQAVSDGGLLCVTCTDLTVLATNNYPEKCFSNYGGVSLKAEYCHESALRLLLHSLSTSAGRYGRWIEPVLSLSIDFYVRDRKSVV